MFTPDLFHRNLRAMITNENHKRNIAAFHFHFNADGTGCRNQTRCICFHTSVDRVSAAVILP